MGAWLEIEAQEIDRFAINLQLFIDSHDENPAFNSRIKLLRYNPDNPQDMHWLHEIVQG